LIQIQAEVVTIENHLFERKVTDDTSRNDSLKKSYGLLIKHVFDKLIALIALIVLSPLLVLVSLLIKLDSRGPIIFKQNRNGLDNQTFKVWKFRTMRVMENDSKVTQAKKDDDRITRIGNFLRKSSIDELPQLVNVLLGDMAIVGPRPHPVALNDRFRPLIENYDQRCAMKPGLTGLAQINGHRGPTETVEQMRNRIECDIQYIENWSLWSDVKIIIATPYYGLISKNAF
jgi:putative colanic acid biosynthesis UDP-glucose lipid carrier transferase